MKIYTKTGDQGETSLIGGKRVKKNDIRIDAYGTMDELSSWLGLIRDHQPGEEHENFLTTVQHRLFVCGAIFAADCDNCHDMIPPLRASAITELEIEIDRLNESLPPITEFILPGGHQTVSHIHIARNICRRAERIATSALFYPDYQNIVIIYLNRLSDYLFVLGRKIAKDLNIKEIAWDQDL